MAPFDNVAVKIPQSSPPYTRGKDGTQLGKVAWKVNAEVSEELNYYGKSSKYSPVMKKCAFACLQLDV
jgi:hypothetical protein